MHDCLNARTILSIKRSISLDAQTISGDNYKAAIIIYLYSDIATILLLSECLQSQRDSALNKKKKQKIVKIVDKRQTRSNYKYNVC